MPVPVLVTTIAGPSMPPADRGNDADPGQKSECRYHLWCELGLQPRAREGRARRLGIGCRGRTDGRVGAREPLGRGAFLGGPLGSDKGSEQRGKEEE